MADKPDNRSVPEKVWDDIWGVTKKVGGDGVWINTDDMPADDGDDEEDDDD